MSVMESIITGKTPKAPKVLLFGYEGTGKSTWASQAPNPIFIQTEDGLNQIDCKKFPLAETYQQVMDELDALCSEDHDFKTVVIDSLSSLEPMIWDEVCKSFGVKNIEKADGGYAKGYRHAIDWWRPVLQRLNYLNQNKDMMVILIAHVGVQEVQDPETATYDRTAPRLHRLAEAMISQWCDCVFQVKKKFRIQKAADGFGERAIAAPVGADGGDRVIRTVGNTAVIAKNRYNLPEEIPLDFNIFMDAVNKSMEVK